MNYTKDTIASVYGFGIDTIFVVFFLALEIGRGVRLASVDGALMSLTLAVVIVLPYFLPARSPRPALGSWLAIRGTIAVVSLLIGVAFGRGLGLGIPSNFGTLPMTFLILSSMVSCYIQFYSLMRLRPAK